MCVVDGSIVIGAQKWAQAKFIYSRHGVVGVLFRFDFGF